MKTALFLFVAFSLLYPVFVVYRQSRGDHETIVRSPTEWGVPFQNIAFQAEDGIRLKGWWIPADGERAVLLLHGKSGSRNGEFCGIFDLAKWYRDRGYAVMLPDLRAHGESGGDQTCFGIKESEELTAWIERLDPQKRYRWQIHGFSMGAVTALMMKERNPDRFERIIADGPWIDFGMLVRQELRKRAKLPAFAYPYVRRIAETFFDLPFDRVENRVRCAKLCGEKILYIFESEDKLLPPAQIETLKRACPEATIIRFPGVGHVEAFKENPRQYEKVIEMFLENGEMERTEALIR